jgi:PAS domain S-box-containing protein
VEIDFFFRAGYEFMLKDLRNWLIIGFAAAFLMFVGVSWLTYRNMRELISAHERVNATHAIIEQIARFRILLDEAESGSRGFALSGRADYLAPYNNARAQIDQAIQILEHDLAGRPVEFQALTQTQLLITEQLAVMEELIAARRERGTDAAISVVLANRGQALTEQITKRLLQVQTNEQNILLESVKNSDQRTRTTVFLIVLVSLTGLFVLSMAFIYLRRSFHRQEALSATLADTEQKQRTILDGANYSIISTDVHGTILTMNAKAQEWLRYAPEDLIGKNLTLLHDSQELESRAKQLTKSMGEAIAAGMPALIAKARHGVSDDVEWSYIRSDGTRFPVMASMTALRHHDGTLSGYLAMANDLSGRKQLEKMKDDFVSMASHELRTPLTAIRGALGLLAGGVVGKLPERAEIMVQTAVRNTERLTRLTNDILDLARIESGRMAIAKKDFDARDLMKQSVELVQGQANEAGISILVDTSSVVINADPDRIIQAFSNLLGNAIKFSPRGGQVVFKATKQGSAIVLSVADHGRGIPKDKLETVFGRFEQLDLSDSRDRGGTGLGLAICRIIVEQHGGRVWAESEVGQGSTFFVRLPLEASGSPSRSCEGK